MSSTKKPAAHGQQELALGKKAPVGQGRQALELLAPRVSLKVPLAHGVQPSKGLVDPHRSVNQPSGQLMLAQPAAPPGEKRPGAQALQLETGSKAPAGAARPAAQTVAAQLGAPVPLLKRPTSHRMQLSTVAAPVELLYFPGGHGWGFTEPAGQ